MNNAAPSDVVIVAAARTPQGKLKGAVSALTAVQLGSAAIRGALERGGIPAESVDAVLVGQVLAAGAGQNAARQAAIGAGIGWDVHASSVNKVCLSGLTAVIDAARMLRLGDATVVVAAGMESMSRAPHLLMGSRDGWSYGTIEVLDHMALDGLTDAYDHESMGASTERLNPRFEVTREAQDAVAARSHQRAAAAQADGVFEAELVPVTIPQRKGDPVVVTADEGVRPETTVETLAGLRPAFAEGGTITAGNSSQISDGAAAVLLMAREKAEALGLKPRARIVDQTTVGVDPVIMLTGPIPATQKLLERNGMSVDDIDLFEINEAFSSVVAAWRRELSPDWDRVNVNGGALALGHPLGSSGARLITTLLDELERSDKELGLVTMCTAGGTGTGTIIQRI
jgi:acetyl-CoA C-acetyltransferase